LGRYKINMKYSKVTGETYFFRKPSKFNLLYFRGNHVSPVTFIKNEVSIRYYWDINTN